MYGVPLSVDVGNGRHKGDGSGSGNRRMLSRGRMAHRRKDWIRGWYSNNGAGNLSGNMETPGGTCGSIFPSCRGGNDLPGRKEIFQKTDIALLSVFDCGICNLPVMQRRIDCEK